MSTQIIIKRLSQCLNAPKDSLLMGDVRQQMASDLMKSLEEVVNRKADYREPYYILIATHKDPGKKGDVIKEKILLLSEKPGKLLGTILFRIDNVRGDATIEWILPLDIPAPIFIPTERGKIHERVGVKGIQESSQGLPILNRVVN